MKKIAIDGRMWGSEFTGIGNYVREISLRMFEMKSNIDFILFLSSLEAEKAVLPKNVTVILADEPIYSLAEQFSFARKISKVKPDITWFPHFNVPFFFRQPFITTIHDLTILKYPGKKMRRFWHRVGYSLVLRHALKKAKHIISVSEYTKSEILHFSKMNSKTISVIWNGVDKKRFSNPDVKKVQEFQKRFGMPFFLITGVWREHKNIPNAIRAFTMYRKFGGKGSLVITGKPDPYYPEVKKMAQSSVFSKDIFLTGFISEKDIPALFSAASVLLFPSISEGFGLPAIEAMSAGTPVVCSNRSSLPEICGKSALYFDPFDSEDIALKMIDGLDEKITQKLILRGKKRIQEFPWHTATKKTLRILLSQKK